MANTSEKAINVLLLKRQSNKETPKSLPLSLFLVGKQQNDGKDLSIIIYIVFQSNTQFR